MATQNDDARRAIFDLGNLVGLSGQARFPGGKLVKLNYSKPQEAVRETAALMGKPTIHAIYEGAFLFDDILVRPDIVARQRNGTWHVIECKSSTKVKPGHHWDVAVQAYVMRGMGYSVSRSLLMHVNSGYVGRGPHRVGKKFMTQTDVTAAVDACCRQIATEVAKMKRCVLV